MSFTHGGLTTAVLFSSFGVLPRFFERILQAWPHDLEKAVSTHNQPADRHVLADPVPRALEHDLSAAGPGIVGVTWRVPGRLVERASEHRRTFQVLLSQIAQAFGPPTADVPVSLDRGGDLPHVLRAGGQRTHARHAEHVDESRCEQHKHNGGDDQARLQQNAAARPIADGIRDVVFHLVRHNIADMPAGVNPVSDPATPSRSEYAT